LNHRLKRHEMIKYWFRERGITNPSEIVSKIYSEYPIYLYPSALSIVKKHLEKL
jgi:hypothetical protein